jgi:hypothetical protein
VAGEVPRVVPACARLTRAALHGAPLPRALHNTVVSPGAAAEGAVLAWAVDGTVCRPCRPWHGVSSLRLAQVPANRQRDFWGYGRIEGKVTVEGTPASRRVRLFDVRTALVIGETWSRQDGRYRFDFLDPSREYFVLAHDHVRQFNAVVADNVKPEVMVGDRR